MKTIAILLAAGASERMGATKQLISIDNKSLLLHALTPLLESRISKVILVLGYNNEKILKHIPTSEKLVTVINDNYSNGMGRSIKAGLAHLEPNTDAVMIALADQPFITVQTINNLLKSASITKKNIIAPIYNGKRGHPVIFKKKYFQELLQLTGDEGGRSILELNHDDTLLVDLKTDAILIDIDTPKDLETAIKKIRRICEEEC